MRINVFPCVIYFVCVFIGQTVAQGDKLPIKKVVLLNTGVGYFQHEGTVDGDAQVELMFGVNDINDLLKSMVLQDLDGR